MPATNANNSTWCMLREPADFERRPRPPGIAVDDDPGPRPGWSICYDDLRAVLELIPAAPEAPRSPPPGLARDGVNTYESEPEKGRVLVHRCDGSRTPLGCDPCTFRRPAGLAIDRRGFLYVADRAAGHVIVISPAHAHTEARLGAGDLQDPVDVAIAPDGRIYVVDAHAGTITAYSPRFNRTHAWKSRNSEGQPLRPRPIAIAIDPDGSLLVFDAAHPCLLRFSLEGAPLADAAHGSASPRRNTLPIPAGTCPTRGCPAPHDPFDRIVALHRDHRLAHAAPSRRFERRGEFISAILDAGIPGTTWHKIELDADMPPETRITVQSASAEAKAELTGPIQSLPWTGPERDGAPVPFSPRQPDQLIQAPPGRFLRLRVRLESDGSTTPSIRAVRILYPRHSYLDLLPRIYRRDADSARFLESFLALFEHTLTAIEDRYEDFTRHLNPAAAPPEILEWLACLIDLSFDPDWPIDRRRALIAIAMELYRIRGTPGGLREYIRVYTGFRADIVESFTLRSPRAAAPLGAPGAIIGCGAALIATSPDLGPAEAQFGAHAHRFEVLVHLADPCDEPRIRPVVDRIVTANKPAHTTHEIRVITPGASLGRARVGLDLVLGARTPAGTRIDDTCRSATPPGTLGIDTVLASSDPRFPTPRGTRL